MPSIFKKLKLPKLRRSKRLKEKEDKKKKEAQTKGEKSEKLKNVPTATTNNTFQVNLNIDRKDKRRVTFSRRKHDDKSTSTNDGTFNLNFVDEPDKGGSENDLQQRKLKTTEEEFTPVKGMELRQSGMNENDRIIILSLPANNPGSLKVARSIITNKDESVEAKKNLDKTFRQYSREIDEQKSVCAVETMSICKDLDMAFETREDKGKIPSTVPITTLEDEGENKSSTNGPVENEESGEKSPTAVAVAVATCDDEEREPEPSCVTAVETKEGEGGKSSSTNGSVEKDESGEKSSPAVAVAVAVAVATCDNEEREPEPICVTAVETKKDEGEKSLSSMDGSIEEGESGEKSPPAMAVATCDNEEREPEAICVTTVETKKDEGGRSSSTKRSDEKDESGNKSPPAVAVAVATCDDEERETEPSCVTAVESKEGEGKKSSSTIGSVGKDESGGKSPPAVAVAVATCDDEERETEPSCVTAVELKEGEGNAFSIVTAPAKSKEKPLSPNELPFIGKHVLVEKGANRGRTGKVIDFKRKGTALVDFGNSETAGVYLTSMRIIDDASHGCKQENVETEIDKERTRSSSVITVSGKQEAGEPCHNKEETPPQEPLVGNCFLVLKGKNKNKTGKVIRLKGKKTLVMKFDDGEFDVRKSSISLNGDRSLIPSEDSLVSNTRKKKTMTEPKSAKSLHINGGALSDVSNIERKSVATLVSGKENKLEVCGKQKAGEPCNNKEETSTQEPLVGKFFLVVKGKNKNKTGKVIRWKGKKTLVMEFDDGEFDVRISSICLNGDRSLIPLEDSQVSNSRKKKIMTGPASAKSHGWYSIKKFGEDWSVKGSENSVNTFANHRIEKIRLMGSDEKHELTFLKHIFGERLLIVDAPLNGKTNQKPFPLEIEKKGEKYKLISSKLYEDNEKSFGFMKSHKAQLMYAMVSAPDIPTINVEHELLKFGDFTTISPRKVAARFELFQSPTNYEIVQMDASEFCEIKDRGYVGCGFIAGEVLESLLREAGLKDKVCQNAEAIQVRLFIPSLGIFKGMLMRKRHCSGQPIELPVSMQKVLRSSMHDESRKEAGVVICKHKVYPSPGSAHEYIGRNIAPSLKDPPVKSFKQKIDKPLSTMVQRLWMTMGVTKETFKKYQRESRSPERCNHSWLVGVSDPTDCLPPDTIFVCGATELQQEKFFVTRSPCYAHDHGRVLNMCASKPSGMSEEDWEWLNQRKFGTIIFSNPKEGMKSIPERIANGDLDGDLYLVCWDEEILSQMKNVVSLRDEVSDDNGMLSTVPSDCDWFHKAQEISSDDGLLNDIGKLTGKLYKLGEKVADESKEVLNNPDAKAYFEAYNQCLEYKKHGRQIELPSRLKGKGNISSNLLELIEFV